MISKCIKLNHWKFLYTGKITQHVLKILQRFLKLVRSAVQNSYGFSEHDLLLPP